MKHPLLGYSATCHRQDDWRRARAGRLAAIQEKSNKKARRTGLFMMLSMQGKALF
jgi:hypothetical protein